MDKEEIKFYFLASGCIIIFCLIIIAILVIPAYFIERIGFWSDCRIEWQGKLTPVDMVKKVDLNK